MRDVSATAANSRWNTALIVLTMGIGVELLLLGANLLPRRNQASPPVTQAIVPPPAAPPVHAQPAAPPSEIIIPSREVAETPKSVPFAGQSVGSPQKWPVKWRVGYSFRGKDITGFRFGDGANVTFILGGFHGDEPGSTAVCMSLVEYLKKNPGEYSGRTVIVVPACNPDGLKVGTRANARKVDINRNWSYGWRTAERGKLSHGTGPLSEPEVQAIADLLAKYRPHKVVNLHQAMRMLNPTGAGGIALAHEMAKHNRLHVDTNIGYPTPGSFGDYCGKHLRTAMVTYELPGGDNPWAGAKEALLAAIRLKVPPNESGGEIAIP